MKKKCREISELKIEDCGKTAVLQKGYYSLRMSLNLNIFTGTNFDQAYVRERHREATNGLDALYCSQHVKMTYACDYILLNTYCSKENDSK